MSEKVFFDTNVLIYTIGQHDARTPTAEALLSRGGLISVQVLNELASGDRRPHDSKPVQSIERAEASPDRR